MNQPLSLVPLNRMVSDLTIVNRQSRVLNGLSADEDSIGETVDEDDGEVVRPRVRSLDAQGEFRSYSNEERRRRFVVLDEVFRGMTEK